MGKNKKSGKPSIFTTLILASAVIMFWRGEWGLLDEYLLPDRPEMSFICSLVVGTAILILLGRSRLHDLI